MSGLPLFVPFFRTRERKYTIELYFFPAYFYLIGKLAKISHHETRISMSSRIPLYIIRIISFFNRVMIRFSSREI